MLDASKINKLFENKSTKKEELLKQFLWTIASETESCQGAIYLKKNQETEKPVFQFSEGYAFYTTDQCPPEYTLGEGLIGQAAKNSQPMLIQQVPKGYLKVVSGLGESNPTALLIFPFVNPDGHTIALIELAAFKAFENKTLDFLKDVSHHVISLTQ